MMTTQWKLVPDGSSLREFQATLLDANLAMDNNQRGVYTTTTDVEVILKYLVHLHEDMTTNIYRHVMEKLNLCHIALELHEAPSRFAQIMDGDSMLFIRHWLEAKIDMISNALHQEHPSAQTATIRFFAIWHQIVSDHHLQ